MKRTNLPKQFQELLDRCQYATIATTCADGQPWSTPLFVYFDEELRMYWASWPGNQHSQNIAVDPRLFATIFETDAPEGEGNGLYLKMTAREVLASDVSKARSVYVTDFGEDGSHDPFVGTCERRLYMATPTAIWFNDESKRNGQFVDCRVGALTGLV